MGSEDRQELPQFSRKHVLAGASDFGSTRDAQVGAEALGGPWLWNPTVMPPTMHMLTDTQPVPCISLSEVVRCSVHVQIKYPPIPTIASECPWT